MNESGVFRTKLFGGFDKKDVFEYFESIKSEKNQVDIELTEKNSELLNEIDKKDLEINSLNKEIRELKSKIIELDEKIDKQNLNEHQNVDLLSENEKLTKRIAGLEYELFEASKKLDDDSSFKARCDILSHKVVKMQSELMISKSALQKESEKNSAISQIIKSTPSVDTNDIHKLIDALDKLMDYFKTAVDDFETISINIDTAKKELD